MRVEKGLIQMHYGGEGLDRGGIERVAIMVV
jgi:hypothetical protein